MNRDDLKKRLNSLYDNLRYSNEEILSKYYLLNLSKNDRDEYFKKIFFNDYLPTKVINYSKDKVNQDIDLEILDKFVSGIDDYVRNQEIELNRVIVNHQTAVKIFREIISLPSPMSDLLYLTYFKKYKSSQVMAKLFLSRPTYFRTKRIAINMLLNKLNIE